MIGHSSVLRIGRLFALVLGVLCLGAVASAQQVEPEVACDEGVIPEPVRLAYGVHTTNCVITPASEIDTFDFVGSAGDLVRIVVHSRSPGFDPELEVRDPSFALIVDGPLHGASCDGSAGFTARVCSFRIDLTLALSGTYSLALFDAGSNEAGNYVIQLERIRPIPPSFAVAYDTPETDGISPETDIDYFTFQGTVGTDIRFTLRSLTNAFDPQVEVRDPNGEVIIDQFCDGSAGFTARTCTVLFDLSPALDGTYQILVFDAAADETGSYELNLLCLFGPCDSDGVAPPDAEPPDVAYGDAPPQVDVERLSPLADSISQRTDGDRYRLRVSGGTEVTIVVSSTSNSFDPALEVRAEDGTVLVSGVSDGAWCNGSEGFTARTCSFFVDLSPSMAETYSLLLYDVGADETGNYQLGIWCLYGSCDSDGIGASDGTPPLVSYVTAVSAAINPIVDSDRWTFPATTGTTLRLNVHSSTNAFDPVVEVRDPTGAVVIDGSADGASCDGSSGFTARTCSFTVNLTPASTGVFSIVLFDAGFNENGNANFNLECMNGACDSDRDGIQDGAGPVLDHNTTAMDATGPTTDIDFMILLGTEMTLARINVLSRTNAFDPAIEIRDPMGNVVVNGVADNAWCDGSSGFTARTCSFTVDLTPLLTGIYRLSLYDVGVDETGSYSVSLQCLAGSCGDPAGPFEADNCTERANGPLIPDAGGNVQLDTDADGSGNACDGDFDQSGVTDFGDLGMMKADFFCTPATCMDSQDEDMNGNQLVEFLDLGLLKSRFFLPPGPSGESMEPQATLAGVLETPRGHGTGIELLALLVPLVWLRRVSRRAG